MSVEQFLLARIAEAETAALLVHAAIGDEGKAPGYHRAVMWKQRKEWPSFWNAWAMMPSPARVARACAVQRNVVFALIRHGDADTLRALANIYADHPDYNPADWL